MKINFTYCPFCGQKLEAKFIDGKDRQRCPVCRFVDYKNPLPVTTAIAVRDGRYLLIKRGLAPRKGSWSFPSGFIEEGESAAEACLRELREETGLSGSIEKLVAVARVEDRELYGDMLAVIYLVAVAEGEPTAGEDAEDVRFFEECELPEFYRSRFADVIELVRNGLQEKRE